MDLWSLLITAAVGVAGYYIRHRQGDPAAPVLPGVQPSPSVPVPVVMPPLLPALQAITQRPAFQMLLSALAHQAASTPTKIDDMLVQIAQSITAPPAPLAPAPAQPAK